MMPFIRIVGLGLLLAPGTVWAGKQPKPAPNVLFVLADQWRAQAFGFAGDPNVKTPHLGRLAGQSVRFINAIGKWGYTVDAEGKVPYGP